MAAVPADIGLRFGQNLLRTRRLAGLSQEELAIAANLHRSEVSLMERGLRLPRIDTVVKLACSLQAPVDELLDGIDWRPGSTDCGGFTLPRRRSDASLG